ncbi:MAG: hypothetical protein PF541_01490 [Prolixibacteraceae bacterium]|jgi:hypothetical protein|nr:hypothetical protein [Prolixibacteraceae bacterium]
MSKLKNIAKNLTLLAILLVVGASYAFAQENTSGEPYINSKQMYQVPMGDFGNTFEWELYDGTTTHDLCTVSWADTSRSNPNAIAVITFQDATFNPEQNWTLIYSEYDNTDNCVAKRSLPITTKANSFYLSMPDDAKVCNPMSGSVFTNVDVIDVDDTISIPFDVYINKATDFRVTSWTFTGNVDVSAGYVVVDPVVALGAYRSGTTNRGYSWSIAVDLSNNFKLTVSLTLAQIAAQKTEGYTADTLTLYADIFGSPVDDVDVTLTISAGEASSGENYTKTTLDNDSGKKVFTEELFGIPNTSIISVAQN